MTTFEERIFGLAAEALAEQERQVAEIRSRASTLLAAGAVVASLLVHPIFVGSHHHRALAITATAVGAAGGLVLLGAALALLSPYRMAFSLNATRTYQRLYEQGLTEQPGMDLALADKLTERRDANTLVIDQLTLYLRAALAALAIQAAGLAAAAAIAS